VKDQEDKEGYRVLDLMRNYLNDVDMLEAMKMMHTDYGFVFDHLILVRYFFYP
jgi:hypothetical protein